MAEGLPKSGAQLQGAENGAAYACARGMDGEKKITTHAAANRTALLRLRPYNCSRSRTASWPLLLLPDVFLPLIYWLTSTHTHILEYIDHHHHQHQHHSTNSSSTVPFAQPPVVST